MKSLLTLAAASAVLCSCSKTPSGEAHPPTPRTDSAVAVKQEDSALVSKEDGFRITFPPGHRDVTTTRDSAALEDQQGMKYGHTFINRDAQNEYVMAVNTLPFQIGRDDESQFIQVAQEAVNSEYGAKIDKSEDSNINGHLMRTVEFSAGDPAAPFRYGKYRWIVVGAKVYSIAYMGQNKEEIQQPDNRGYFDSFALLE